MTTTPPIPVETMSYEQALSELEEIVLALEDGQKPLEQAMSLYERGQALAQRCQNLLDTAELRVRQLTGEDEEAG
jgi:exodeoxyribonuclease VII small subunit